MTSEEVRDLLALLLVVILIARVIVLVGYEQRSSKLWTAGLPTVAFAALVGRTVVARRFDIDLEADWVSAGFWAFNLVAQTLAVLYGYFPAKLVRAQRRA